MSNTRYHSIGLKVKEKQESNPGRQSDDRMESYLYVYSISYLLRVYISIVIRDGLGMR